MRNLCTAHAIRTSSRGSRRNSDGGAPVPPPWSATLGHPTSVHRGITCAVLVAGGFTKHGCCHWHPSQCWTPYSRPSSQDCPLHAMPVTYGRRNGSGGLGSDGGGSIRIPSSFCGLFGQKGSMGRVPLYPGTKDERYPGVSSWESLEHIGPLTHRCRQRSAHVGARRARPAGPVLAACR